MTAKYGRINCPAINILRIGGTEELKEELEYTIEYIDYVYSSYSVSHTDTTKALINGELSLKDVFLSEKYDYDLV